MSLNNFIPKIWSARLLVNLNKSLVFAQEGVVNTDYEGDISQFGDRVQITAIGAVTVSTYTKNTDMSNPQVLDGADTTLLIDQSKAYNFSIDDVDKRQGQPKIMDDAMREAAYALGNDADQYIASLYTDVASANAIGTDGSPKSVGTGGSDANAYELLVDMSVKLDENNVPAEGRWVVVPAWYHGLLLKDQRFVSFGTAENKETLRNGRVGQAAGFTILKSNNVVNTSGTLYKIMAGFPGAITFANQILAPEAFRSQKQFADVMRGLHLYGAKVIRPNGLVVTTANKA